jgi:hypothetical protein
MTPACIAIEYPGCIKCIYLSQDGYLKHAGKMLFYYWNTLEKVEQLLSGGDLYLLSHEMGEPHDFFVQRGTIPFSWSSFATRDYGRRGIQPENREAQEFTSLKELLDLNEEQDTEYTYLFRDGKWYIFYIDTWEEITEKHFQSLVSYVQIVEEVAEQPFFVSLYKWLLQRGIQPYNAYYIKTVLELDEHTKEIIESLENK